MNFCVLVKISKRIISFWYQSDGSPYAPLIINASNQVPLFFYVNGNSFIFGNSARDRFNSNDPNAFGNYFEIVKDPSKHFNIYGNKKPVKQLLYFGIEQYLSHFINTVLYKSDSIESYRPQFPLRFVFENDIEDKEKSLIESLFTDAGYNNIERIDFNESLFRVLRDKNILSKTQSVLLLNGIDNILFLELYSNILETPIALSRLEGQGADPRVRILAEMIIEDIIQRNSYLSLVKDNEIGSLLSYSAGLLQFPTPIIKGDVELLDGQLYWFRVNQRNLNDRLLYYSNDIIIYTAIDDLIKSHGLKSESTTIILGSKEINTSYFLHKLLKKYPNVIGIEAADSIDAMKLVFFKIAESGYLSGGRNIKAYLNSSDQDSQQKSQTVSTRPPLPEIKQSKKPPLPEIKRPTSPLWKNGIETDQNYNSKKLALPPLPPSTKRDLSDNQNTNKVSGARPKLPPLPSLKKK